MNPQQPNKKTDKITSNNLLLFLFLTVIWSLAVVQPIMSMLGNGPTFLVAHDVRGWSLILSTLTLSFIPPLLMWLTTVITGWLSDTFKEWFARALSTLLLALFFLPFFNNMQSFPAVAIALLIAATLLFLILRTDLFKTVALWLSPVVLIFMGQFLFFSAANQLLPKFVQDSNTIQGGSDAQFPLFVIVLDEFPLQSIQNNHKEIDETRFPAFAELAQDATWYPNAKTISSATNLALPAILTGENPIDYHGKVGTYEQFPNNLFSLLSASHQINAVESFTSLCPPHLCQENAADMTQLLIEDTAVIYLHRISPTNIRKKLPAINDRWIGYLQEFKEEKATATFSERQETFNDFIASFEKHPKNTVHFLHILLPHAPWNMLPDLKLYGFYEPEGTPGQLDKNDPKASVAHQWLDDPWATELAWRKHLLQVGATDALIKKTTDRIKELGLYEQAMIAVVADHGSAFIAGQSRRFAHQDNIAAIAAIPLIVKYPNQKTGAVDMREANNFDLLPTILDVFRVPMEDTLSDGMSLRSEEFRKEPLDMVQEGRVLTPLTGNYSVLYDQQLQRQTELFPGDGWTGIYQTQRNQTFYEKPVSALDVQEVKTNAIKLLNANLYSQALDPNGQYVPVYYRLQHLLDDDVNEILVSLNGQIISHCIMFQHAPKECAGLIDPEKLYKQGHITKLNMRFFAVNQMTNNSFVVDELLSSQINQATLSQTENHIRFDSEDPVKIDNDSTMFGTATLRMTNNDAAYLIDGWAGNTITGKPAKEIYLFVDNQLVATVATGMKKPYLLGQYGLQELTNAGYQITLPIGQVPSIQQHQLRLFANDGDGLISELNYYADANYQHLYQAFNSSHNRSIIKNSESMLTDLRKQAIQSTLSSPVDALLEESAPYLAGDWYTIHDHTRWVGKQIFVVLPTPKNQTQLTIDISASPFIRQGLLEQQSIEVSVNNKVIEQFELVERRSYHLRVNTELPESANNDPVSIMLKMPKATAPSELENSSDVRKLSLFLTKFKVQLQ